MYIYIYIAKNTYTYDRYVHMYMQYKNDVHKLYIVCPVFLTGRSICGGFTLVLPGKSHGI